ncbi:methylmalonyl-CoA epimerase [Kiritimatiellaeota bacterium B1221]|nr:methylmalonyl-CoA epimerase [Kiritimatiellaeota bacterium B1221]
MIQKVDHIGIAVRSIEESIPLYEKALGLKFLKTEEVESQKVKTAFFEAGETHIELLEPTADDSPIAIFIEKKGEGIHHIAFGSDDILGQLSLASGEGVKLIHETPIDGAGGKQVAFLHPKSTKGVLTEICSH